MAPGMNPDDGGNVYTGTCKLASLVATGSTGLASGAHSLGGGHTRDEGAAADNITDVRFSGVEQQHLHVGDAPAFLLRPRTWKSSTGIGRDCKTNASQQASRRCLPLSFSRKLFRSPSSRLVPSPPASVRLKPPQSPSRFSSSISSPSGSPAPARPPQASDSKWPSSPRRRSALVPPPRDYVQLEAEAAPHASCLSPLLQQRPLEGIEPGTTASTSARTAGSMAPR
ncbi:hypothetical protein DFH06DRAFT_1440225 [Mycena polygramma]|nr:hypothetical protein DFH06DRAFT_1440225 [Mycena polygramma]